jgi:hypothetical protein
MDHPIIITSIRRQHNTTVQGVGCVIIVSTDGVPCTVGTTVSLVQTTVQVHNREEWNEAGWTS